MSESEQPSKKVYFGVPADYWNWSEEQQLQWAREMAKSLQARFLGTQGVPQPQQGGDGRAT